MPVIPSSYLNLVRARRELESAFYSQDWEQVKHWDATMGECLGCAFDDEHRNTGQLIQELERILGLYAQIVSSLPEQASTLTLAGGAGFALMPVND